MHRLRCGETLIKLVRFDTVPEAHAPAGHIPDGTGVRYFSIHVANVEEMMAACTDAGVEVVKLTREPRPGLTIALVADPHGNIVEFVRDET